jgi:hypothetical protein
MRSNIYRVIAITIQIFKGDAFLSEPRFRMHGQKQFEQAKKSWYPFTGVKLREYFAFQPSKSVLCGDVPEEEIYNGS